MKMRRLYVIWQVLDYLNEQKFGKELSFDILHNYEKRYESSKTKVLLTSLLDNDMVLCFI